MLENSLDFFNAIKKGDIHTVDAMTAQDPDYAGARDMGGTSAVLTAIYYQHPEIADLLIERGAPLSLFEATAAGRLDIVREILTAAPRQVNSWSPDGFQPLGLACFFGHRDLVEYLLSIGAEVNSPSHNLLAVQPINSAVAGQHLEITRMLLEHGADPNARQGEDFTPLHGAAQNGQVAMIQLLLDHGADPSAITEKGKRPVDYAIEGGHEGAVKLLSAK